MSLRKLCVRRLRKVFPSLFLAAGIRWVGSNSFTDTICIDARSLDRVISFDQEHGLIEAEAGIQWPKLIHTYLGAQTGRANQWGIAQKQTGADIFTLGGSLSSNVHGRGLAMKPLISNVESFTLINADGKSIRCSRDENNELFRIAIGGYGLLD
jgi:FAD/FMN-containing dehydrogenase